MIFDKERIEDVVEQIKLGNKSKSCLKELLGGERLDAIFDVSQQNAMFENVIRYGRIHNRLEIGDGYGVLENLLDGRIRGTLTDFYSIKPEFILSLSPEEQKNMADSISGGREDLSNALQSLWSNGVKTEACTTRDTDNTQMVQCKINSSEFEQQDIIQQLYNHEEITGNIKYDAVTKDFTVNLSGNNLYNYCISNLINVSDNQKPNIFEGKLREDLQRSQKMYDYFHSIGQDKPKLRDTILSCNESLSLISERNREIKKGGHHNPKSPESMSFKEQLKGQTYSSNEIARVDADTVMEPVVKQPEINQPTITGYENII